MEKEYAHELTREELAEGGITERNYFTFEFTRQNVQNLEGQMLTLVEAVIPNQAQCKATKDIIRQMFCQKYDWLFEAAHLVNVDTDYAHEIIPIKK